MLLGLANRLISWIANGASGSDYTLVEAARLALSTAQKEHLPLAHVATQSGVERAPLWFAKSMLQVIVIGGRLPGTARKEALTHDLLGGLTLDSDMCSLRAPGDKRPCFVDLFVIRGEFEKYIRWARTVQ